MALRNGMDSSCQSDEGNKKAGDALITPLVKSWSYAMKFAKAHCRAALIVASLAAGSAQAANTGYIEVHLNTDSCSYVTQEVQGKAGEVEVLPKTLDAKYLQGNTGPQDKNFDYWVLTTKESSVYTCHNPKPTLRGGYLEVNYFQIVNPVIGLYSANRLTDSFGRLLLQAQTPVVSSTWLYLPPLGHKIFDHWPGNTSYALRAEAYWMSGDGGPYAYLTINTRFD